MDLQGKVALVTGGAHRVGKAIALALAERGADVAIHYGRAHDEAAATVAELTAAGAAAMAHAADLSSVAAIDGLFAAVDARFGRLDILVNSAAEFHYQRFDRITAEDWDQTLAVNLRAPFLCTQRAARLMKREPRDTPALVVNIADLSGVGVWPGYVQHGVSKAGLLHLTRIAALELAPAVRVNALVLGPIMPVKGRGEDEAWRRLLDSLPLRRAGGGAAVGEAVVFLAQSDFTTGATLELDGGEHLLGPGGE